MAYIPTGFAPAEEAEIKAQLAEIIERQRTEERNRKLAFVIGAGGALLAAIRLGVIFAPKVRRKRLGTLGEK